MAWQSIYQQPGNAFGIKDPRFYGPQGHRGKDYVNAAGTWVFAYAAGVVTKVQRSSYIGLCVVVRLDNGQYAGWAHLRGVVVSVGDRVGPGTHIAEVAGASDSPGSTWAGAHIHTTLGPSNESIFEGTVYDPAPGIASAIAGGGAAPAGGNKTTTGNTIGKRDPDMARRLNIRETKDGINNTSTLYFDGGPGVGIKPIQNAEHLTLLNRYLADAPGDHMYPGEIAIVNSYLRP